MRSWTSSWSSSGSSATPTSPDGAVRRPGHGRIVADPAGSPQPSANGPHRRRGLVRVLRDGRRAVAVGPRPELGPAVPRRAGALPRPHRRHRLRRGGLPRVGPSRSGSSGPWTATTDERLLDSGVLCSARSAAGNAEREGLRGPRGARRPGPRRRVERRGRPGNRWDFSYWSTGASSCARRPAEDRSEARTAVPDRRRTRPKAALDQEEKVLTEGPGPSVVLRLIRYRSASLDG